MLKYTNDLTKIKNLNSLLTILKSFQTFNSVIIGAAMINSSIFIYGDNIQKYVLNFADSITKIKKEDIKYKISNIVAPYVSHIGKVTGIHIEKIYKIIITHGEDSRIIIWDIYTGSFISEIFHPNLVTRPACQKSVLSGDYLIVSFSDRSIVIFGFRDDKIYA